MSDDPFDFLPRRFQAQIKGRRWQAARQREERAVREFEETAVRAEQRALRDEIASEWAALVATILREHGDKFKPYEREALRLSDVEQLSNREAWLSATDCSTLNAYKQRLLRARRKLRRIQGEQLLDRA